MLRNQLSAAVESAAQELGYGFRQGFEYRMGEVPIRFPAVWLVPPHVVRVEGREEGEIVYRATLHLMTADTTSKPRKDNGPKWNATRWP